MSDSVSPSSSPSSSSSSLSPSRSSSPIPSSSSAPSSPRDDSLLSDGESGGAAQDDLVALQQSSSQQLAPSEEVDVPTQSNSARPTEEDEQPSPMTMNELVASSGSMSRSSSPSSSPVTPSSGLLSSSNVSGAAADPELPEIAKRKPSSTSSPVAAAKRTASSSNHHSTKLPNFAGGERPRRHQSGGTIPSSKTKKQQKSKNPPQSSQPTTTQHKPLPALGGAHRVPTAPPNALRRKGSPPKSAQKANSFGHIYRYPFPRAAPRSPPRSVVKRSGWVVGRVELEESALSIDKSPLHPHPPKSADQAHRGGGASHGGGVTRYMDELLAPRRPGGGVFNECQPPPTGRRAQRYATKWLHLHDGEGGPTRGGISMDGTSRSLDVARDGKTSRYQVGVSNPLQLDFNPYQSSSSAHRQYEEDGRKRAAALAIEEGPVDEGSISHIRGGRIVTPEGEESRRKADSEEASSSNPESTEAASEDVHNKDDHDMARWLVDFSLKHALNWYRRDHAKPSSSPPPCAAMRPVVADDDVPAAALWAADYALSRAVASHKEDIAQHALQDEVAAAAAISAAEEEQAALDPETRSTKRMVDGYVAAILDRAVGVHAMYEFQHAATPLDQEEGEYDDDHHDSIVEY